MAKVNIFLKFSYKKSLFMRKINSVCKCLCTVLKNYYAICHLIYYICKDSVKIKTFYKKWA